MIYDITNNESFLNIKNWLKEVNENTDNKSIKCLIGNKIDLVEAKVKKREVLKEDAQKFAMQNNLIFFETSACKNININLAFEEIAESNINIEYFFNII